jgi:hypothetical protein
VPAFRSSRMVAKCSREESYALGHCMRKLLHLVFAVWKTGQPFNAKHYSWIQEDATPATETAATMPAAQTPITKAPLSEAPAVIAPSAPKAENDKAVGHKRDRVPEKQVVTTASSSVKPALSPVNPPSSSTVARPKVDFAYLRQQVTMEQVLSHLGILSLFKGTGEQRRGPCPVHAEATASTSTRKHTCSVQLGKYIFQCFKAECAAKGNITSFGGYLPPTQEQRRGTRIGCTASRRKNGC